MTFSLLLGATTNLVGRNLRVAKRPAVKVIPDFATLSKKSSDYTVMIVIGFGCDGRMYIVDFIRDKMKLSEKRDKLLGLVRRHRPSIIFWEENASVEGGEAIQEEIDRIGWAGLEFYAFRQPTTISKEDRIGKLEPDFRAGKILDMLDCLANVENAEL